MRNKTKLLIVTLLTFLVASSTVSEELLSFDVKKETTYIKSKSLTLHSKKRHFVYKGEVELTQGDIVLTSKTLEGFYNKKNEIETLIALGDVVITKGKNIRATSQKAVYEKETEIFTLTKSPELQRDGNILTADAIKIYTKEDKSIAEGSVRVKVVEEDDNKKKNNKTN